MENNKIEWTPKIICPYCGAEVESDNDIWYDEEEYEEYCDSCDKDFYVYASVKITYYSDKPKKLSMD